MLKGVRQQPIPRENRHVIAKNLVIGQFTAPIIIIVHGGEIIMNQGHGMYHLQRTSRRQSHLPSSPHHFAGG